MILPTMAISIRQPWAWAILHLIKDVENRTWTTKFRGPVLIHAGNNTTRSDTQALVDTARPIGHDLSFWTLRLRTYGLRGGIVGMVTIKDCITDSPSPWAEDGRFHWLLADAKPLPFFSCKGRLGLFPVEYPQHLLEAA